MTTMSTYPPERFNATDLWAEVKKFTGRNSATLEQTLDAFKAAGIDEGAWDGAHDLIEESGLVTMGRDCTFRDVRDALDEVEEQKLANLP